MSVPWAPRAIGAGRQRSQWSKRDLGESDTSIAIVDDGSLVPGIAKGQIGVSATSEGVSDTAFVTVLDSSEGTLIVSPSADTLHGIADTATLTVEARDADGSLISDPDVQWSSEDTTIATGDSMGAVIARVLGIVIISATFVCCGDSSEITDTGGGSQSSTYPNLPSGDWNVVDSFDGSVREADGHAFGMSDFGSWNTDASAPEDQIEVVSDATNPAGSDQALRFRYSDGLNPASGKATASTFAGGPYSELYLIVRIYMEEGGWDFGHKYFFLGLANGGRPGATDTYVDRPGGSTIRFVNQNGGSPNPVIESDETEADGGTETNPIVFGAWNNIEMHIVDESSPGANDGEVYLWVNGELAGQRTGVDHGTGGGEGWTGMQWYGESNSVPTESYYRLGELYIAGR